MISAVNRVEFVSDRMSYLIVRGLWCDIFLNVHAPTEDKMEDIKDRFYEELEHVLNKLPKYHMEIMLGVFNANVGREDIFKPTIGNESLHEISNDNGVRVVNFATPKNLIIKSTMFPHHNSHKFKQYLKDRIDKLATNSKNKNIRDLYRGINDFQRGYQPRSNLVKDENDDLLADSNNIMNMWRNYFSQLLNVCRVSEVRQIEIHIAEPLVPDNSDFEVEIAIAKLKTYKSPGSD
ncbi:hypothetical protein B7P43_G05232 [Cryptotermes secundus]|uniref:Endonuclease/exonuclease/phosphatase domain-containing protein n=1 Tax=Cryptotermes secundus TaxID=105785 RepID=A0A2J7PLR8_9NEOP|nr:hypothetical protein B7P43_G05232 [Cryptotermes secundus]